MMDIKQRPLTKADLTFVMDELAAGARTGNFSNNFIDSRISKPFEKQIREMIRVRDTGKYTGHYFNIIARGTDGNRLGFIWLQDVIIDEQPGLELRVLCVSKRYRGNSIATAVLNNILEHYAERPFQAKCYAKSTQMIEMLKKRGVNVLNTAASGNMFLVRNASLHLPIIKSL
ncbi:GNAT family N-acetyltransferase [Citrobacter freundii]|uniref:GNAT family N-acetyltransferase n=1 Tax=Citrobacter freundii TaxID=546 RepID=UPI0005CD87AB|nr:GNAT family N-acetyltransferase [Citrobacter freundii]EIX7373176.1 GNAT family N-acetyltransferase [Citrobacter freundii]EKU2552376.1 GNAT family N-acetyltransferase [Citrobacter freundii]KJC07705.1 hypothetical protein TO64_12290 [Citrobacter freundii]MBM7197764.1 GNAT family N-acetyltransferase [Citrobacter freundii]MBM7203065.1 GNAT family N-acetyltransferase [Citrobacter freundii]